VGVNDEIRVESRLLYFEICINQPKAWEMRNMMGRFQRLTKTTDSIFVLRCWCNILSYLI